MDPANEKCFGKNFCRFDLWCYVSLGFFCSIFVWMTCVVRRVSYFLHPLLLCEGHYVISAVVVFILWTWIPCVWYIHVYNSNIFCAGISTNEYVVSFLYLLIRFALKSILSDINITYACLLMAFICLEWLFHPLSLEFLFYIIIFSFPILV